MTQNGKRAVDSQPALLIVDPHTLLAEAIANAALNAGYQDVKTANDEGAIHRLLNSGWRPDIFMLDYRVAHHDEFVLIAELLSRYPKSSIIIMVSDQELQAYEAGIVQAFVKGVMGIVSKDYGISSLLRVIEVVAGGEVAIPRDLARSVVQALRLGPTLMTNDVGLTERQREVLALIAQGLTDREISRRLAISMPTVRSHVEAIFEKTGSVNRTAAARWAIRHLRVVSIGDERPS